MTYYYDEDGETVLDTEQVMEGMDCVNVPTPTKADAVFLDWTNEVGGAVDATLTEDVMSDRDLIAVYERETEPEPENNGEEEP